MDYNTLGTKLAGELFTDLSHRTMYATDASPYKEMPLAVVVPRNVADLKTTIRFAREHRLSVIPRGGGTSLAGQVVGSGIVVDISKHFTHILELNAVEKWVMVEPGVILNELNQYLKPHGLFFAPETSTASRCTIGGMLGNNSCGLHSLVYGSTRDHTLEVQAILSDGSEVRFGPIDHQTFRDKCQGSTLENQIYRKIDAILSDEANQAEIRKEFPEKTLPRKNTGYALDELLDQQPFNPTGKPFNLSKLLAGSEGTLAFATAIKLNLVEIPPAEKAVMCVHFRSLEEALQANLIALKHHPEAVELMDDQILKLTEGNILQKQNRFFVKGEPGAILIIEFIRENRDEIRKTADDVEKEMVAAGLGYHFPLIFDARQIGQVWDLRRSGLGILSNIPGDGKPVSVIEDWAVHPRSLPDFIAEFKETLAKYGLSCVYHAHVGSGEIHTRPILNLKDKKDVETYRLLAVDMAHLVKKYNGSLSGEHGDGRLRGEFIPIIIGEKNYRLLKDIKQTFDPDKILNPGKIVDSPAMNSHLRYEPGQETREVETVFDFSDALGYVRAIERCNGAGDCKNTAKTGRSMCPSYQATMDEMMTTRARANLLREFISHSTLSDPFAHQEVYDVLDHCLSCKSCKSECPSGVDMTKLKAEFLQHYFDARGISLRSRLVGNMNSFYKFGSLLPGVTNFVLTNRVSSRLIKSMAGFAPKRNLPVLASKTLKNWAGKNLHQLNATVANPIGEVCLFNDELSNYVEVGVGIITIKLLTKLGYIVHITDPVESARVLLSKGFIRKARKIVEKNIERLSLLVSGKRPLIGLDPSTILTLRDEYIDLTDGATKEQAKELASFAFMIEEFLADEREKGRVRPSAFTGEKKTIKVHGHCHQKVLSSITATVAMLSIPDNYTAEPIDAGCCGMAGSFGYEVEHYELSNKIGELKLFPEIRKTDSKTLIAAPGLSCRQQILDNTGRRVHHPVEILFDAVRRKN